MHRSLPTRLRVLRAERGLTLRDAEHQTGVDKDTLSKIERGVRHPHDVTLAKIAKGYGVPVEDLLEEPVLAGSKAKAPDTGPPQASQEELTDDAAQDEQPTREPLSPSERRDAAWMRRAELEGVLKHLTLRTETLRAQAKESYQATDKQGLWALFLDSVLLADGAVYRLAQNRKEAEELGFGTEEERHLRSRLEHRTEDLDEVSDNIGNMWQELPYADTEAETQAEPPGHHDVPNIFRKRQAS
jgi:transcriptional regulator with XRE-family HTH domain